jgi:hypothetical protein
MANKLTTYPSTDGDSAEERSDCTNYTTMEAIPTREEVLVGTFFLNEHPIIRLFDSGAS